LTAKAAKNFRKVRKEARGLRDGHLPGNPAAIGWHDKKKLVRQR
jgi:hypothetical protein